MKRTILAILISLTAFSGNAQTLIRGPYLMVGTPSSMVIRWRTDTPTDSKVQFGNAANALSQTATDNNLVTEHEVKLTGLSPKTRYFYSVGSTSATLQGDGNNYFETLPNPGQAGKYRFGVFGDCGVNSAIQGHSRDQMVNYLGDKYLNAWLLLGDNAYSFGKDTEYQSNFFNHYKDSFMKKTPLYPSPGNHDYSNDNFGRQNDHNVPYYDVFTMPQNGEAGGVPSHNEAYYSYDYGNVHFLSLDSYGREDQATRLYDTTGRQVQWIKADLAANQNKDWIVAYWHHPPFTKGSHDSDAEAELTAIRENFIRILERNGVDLIICGHSHLYERSRLMNGFYQKQEAFDPNIFNINNSSGKYDGSTNSCPYIKETGVQKGTVYLVAGSGGQLGGRSPGYPHKAMQYSNTDKGGSVILEVEGNRLDAKWIGEDGQIADQFTIEKGVNKAASATIEYGQSVTLTPSYIGNYNWNNGEITKTITVTPTISTEYKVSDGLNCISDVFKINVSPPLPVKLISFSGKADGENTVTLSWKSAYEVNSSHFSVERSLDGKVFQEAGSVPAWRNTNQEKSYTWVDPTSMNIVNHDTVYYRLVMLDLDGKTSKSATIAIKIQRIEKEMDIEVMPNPSLPGEIQMRLVGKISAEGKMILTEINGRTRISKQIKLTSQPVPFLPEDTAAGIYILKVTIDGSIYTKKVVVY